MGPLIPTFAENGVPRCDVSGRFGLLGPAGTPKPVVDPL
jgi:tripartite-type tricarboxylate transporter receptor subunit TctC